MNNSEIKAMLIRYRFLQNTHFCKEVGINQSTLKYFLQGKFELSESKAKRLGIYLSELNEAFKLAENTIKNGGTN